MELDGVLFPDVTEPSDPFYALQWHHPKIATPLAWDFTQGSSEVIVAVLDTGLNIGLVEFEGRLLPGYDFYNDDADPSDDHGHGTIVTATLAANANNGEFVAGIDWHCSILPIKVAGEDGPASVSSSWLSRRGR